MCDIVAICIIFKSRHTTDIELNVFTAEIKWVMDVMCVLNAYLLSTVGVSSTLLIVAISASVEPSVKKGEKNL